MKRAIAIVVVLALFFLVSGCVQQAVCGNGSCEAGETTENCSADCGNGELPPMPTGTEGDESPPELPF